MSSNVEPVSEPPSEDLKSNSIFDFLYHDARRVASFLAQFETYGVRSQVKATESAAQTGNLRSEAGGGFSAATILRSSASIAHSSTDEERDALEETFDPLWRNAIRLLDYLADREMLVRSIETARIGQFVLVTGELGAFDLALLKETWKVPAAKQAVIAAASPSEPMNRHERRRIGKGKPDDALGAEFGFELLKILPHPIQATVSGDFGTAWSTLREDAMITSGTELLLKHGVAIQGRWSMLGILDATPDENNFGEFDHHIGALRLGGISSEIVGTFATATRTMFGRPTTAYGVTPLLIFRRLTAP